MENASKVFLAIITGVALVGFLQGTSQDPEFTPLPTLTPSPQTDLHPARSYREMRLHPPQSENGWQADLAAMAGPGPNDPVSLEGTSKAADLAIRASRRAYDGAPPRIPHSIRQDSAPECLSCHENGLRFRGLLGTPMSHNELTQCTQCHVVESAPMPGGTELSPDPRDIENRFAGLEAPTSGPRSWDIAPPQIPHTTWMREQCDSCHGTNGRDAIRTTHPWRESCQQCHTASAEIENRPYLHEE